MLVSVRQRTRRMAAQGQSLPKCDVRAMSALPPIATKERTSWDVSNVPEPDLSETAANLRWVGRQTPQGLVGI